MRIYRKANPVISLILTVVLAFGVLPASASAASSKEIQQQINGLKSKKAELQTQIDAIQRDYDANFGEMEALVAEKSTIDQEISLISSKIEAERLRKHCVLMQKRIRSKGPGEQQILMVWYIIQIWKKGSTW